MTDDELARLARLSAEATPGPWVSTGHGTHRGTVAVEERSEYAVETVAECYCGAHHGHGRANAALIAASRTALPTLLAEVRALRAVVAAVVDLREAERRDVYIMRDGVRWTEPTRLDAAVRDADRARVAIDAALAALPEVE